MKKKILFLIGIFMLCFSVITVDAKVVDVSIQSVEKVEENGKVEEINKDFIDGMKVKFDLSFQSLNDSIKYRITLQNKGSEDIYIDYGEKEASKYITYDYIFDDSNNVIKGNSSKTFDVVITYKNLVEDSKFVDGSYEESKSYVIKLSDGTGSSMLPVNPNTHSTMQMILMIIGIVIIIGIIVGFYFVKSKKITFDSLKNMKRVHIISFGIILGLVIVTVIGISYAMEVVEITVESNVKIYKARLARNCSSDSYTVEQTGYCLNWNEVANPDDLGFGRNEETGEVIEMPVILTTELKKEMSQIYTYENMNYKLLYTKDVSDLQNGEVILGVYKTGDGMILLVIGQDGGVIAPIDMSYMFATNYFIEVELEEDEDSLVSNITKEEIDSKRILDVNVMAFMRSMDLSNIKVSDTKNMSGTFRENGNVYAYRSLDLRILGFDTWETYNVTDMALMFYNCNCLIDLDLSSFDTSKVTNMSYMFCNCISLMVLNLNVFDTSKVKYMDFMFNGCNNLTSLNVSNFDTSNVVNMGGMFYNCSSLTNLDVSNFDTSNVTNMSHMFSSCSKLTNLDVSGFDTSKVTDMSRMFYFCSIKNLDVSGFDTSKVTDMSRMFYFCNNLKNLDVSSFDTSKVTDMSDMFYQCSNLMSLNLSNFDTTKVTDMSGIFQYCRNLTNITVSDKWIISNANINNMFNNCGTDHVTVI